MSPGRLKLKLILVTILVVAGGFFVFPKNVLAAPGINKYINFQGKVVNLDGTNVTPAGNPYSFIFCIYTTAAPANPCVSGDSKDAVWREEKSITVTDGIFQTNLGDSTTFPGSVDFNTDNIYLGINFAGNGQMLPLIRFTAVPYALNADKLDGGEWGTPGAIGSTTPNSASFTTLSSTGITNIGTGAGSTMSIGNSTGAITMSSGGTTTWTNTSGNLTLATAASGNIILNPTGNVGIGPSAPVGLFDVDRKLVVLSNGNVGIGTTTPDYNLQVTGTLGIGSTAYFASSVGIGTTDPQQLLHIRNAGDAIIRLEDTLTSGPTNTGLEVYNDDGLYGSLLFERDGDISTWSYGEGNISIVSGGNVGIGTTNPTQGLLTISGGDIAILSQGDTRFYDSDNSNYVGLQAAATTAANLTYTFPGSAPASNGYALVSQTDGTMSWAEMTGGVTLWTDLGSVTYLGTGGLAQTDGVGIGTTAPTGLLNLYSATTDPFLAITAAHNTDFDPMIKFLTDGTPTVKFSMGVDAGDGDKFKIYSGDGIGGTSEFSIDTDGTTSIANLQLGELNFADDSGMISWVDMAVTDVPADNTVESYTAQLDGNPMLTIYGLATGAGAVDNLGVGIGTTAPAGLFDVNRKFVVLSGGNVGIGITNPGYALEVVGNIYASGNITCGGSCGGGSVGIGTTVSSATSGSVFFAGTSGVLKQDNDNFYWDDSLNRLGLGMTAPAYTLDIAGTFRMSTTAPMFGSNALVVAGEASISGTNTGNVSLGTANGLTLSTQQLSLGTASATATGALSSGDWGTFSGKQAGSTNLTSLSGLSYASTAFVKMTNTNTFSLDTTTYLSDGSVYALLAGRGTGQLLYGGTGSGETLTLASTSNGTKGKIIFGATGSAFDEVNTRLGIGTTTPNYRLDIITSTTNDRGVNVSVTGTGTTFGGYFAVSGAATTNVGAFVSVSNATTGYGVQIGGMNSATAYGLDIGALSGATANTAINIGAMSGATDTAINIGALSGTGNLSVLTTSTVNTTGAVNGYQLNLGAIGSASSTATQHVGINLGAISGLAVNAYGLNLGTITGGVTANYGINLGAITSTGATNSYGINIQSLGGTGTNKYGINIATLTGAGTNNIGLYISSPTSTGTGNYGAFIGGPTGAGTSNYGLNITTASGATHNVALELGAPTTGTGTWALYSSIASNSYFAGNVGMGITSPAVALDVASTAWLRGALSSTQGLFVNTSGNVGIGTTSPTQGLLTISGGDIALLTQGDTRFYDSDNFNYVGLQAAAVTAANLVYTLPGSAPASNGYALVSQTDGTMSWAAAGGMSNPMISKGDIIYGGDSGTPARLGGGTSGWVLSFDASTSAPQWIAPGTASVSIGSNITGGTAGAVLFVNGSGQLAQDPAEFFWDNSQKHLGIGTTAVSGAAVTINEEDGTEYLMQLKQDGVNKFVVNNDGGVAISGVTANIVKTSSGDKSLSTDFEYIGTGTAPRLEQVTAVQNQIELLDTMYNSAAYFTTAPSNASTSAAVGAGAHSIVRDDGKVVILHGGGSLTASVWDGSTNSQITTTINVGLTGTAPGAGAISLKRPNGRFLMIGAGGSAGTTVYDPWGAVTTPAAAGPAVCANNPITTGTNAFMRPDGLYQIMCGGYNVSGTYNPNQAPNLGYVAGAAPGAAFGAGAHALQRDDGTFLVLFGGGLTANAIFNPYTNVWSGTAAVSGAPTVNTGAVSVRRQDGKYLVIPGAAGASYIYDPVGTVASPNGTFSAATGVGPSTALGDAAQIVWRQDGKYMLMLGGGSTAVNIVGVAGSIPTFTSDPQYKIRATGAGTHMVPRPDGKYQIINNGNGTNTDTLDMGMVMGGMVGTGGTATGAAYFESECISSNSINPSSTLSWTKNAEGSVNFLARTGTACAALSTYRNISNSGDKIGAAPGDNKVQIRVFLKRNFPTAYDQDWGLWRGLSQTKYRRRVMDPVLYDISINNSSLFHRSQFEFGMGVSASQDASGPVASNINVAANGSLQLSQGLGNNNLASTTNPTGSAYGGAFGAHNSLNQPAGEGSIAMKRPNGTYMVVVGTPIMGGTSVAPTGTIAEIYDPATQTFLANSSAATASSFGVVCSGTTGNTACVPNNGTGAAVSIGRGSLAFKRPDGKFLIVNGMGSATGGTQPNSFTSIYDPVASTFSTGPNLASTLGGSTAPAGRGSQAIPLPNGNVLIMLGAYSTATSIYNPLQNTMIAGPSTSAPIGMGSIVIPRPDGAWLILPGTTSDTCTGIGANASVFDPYAMTFSAVVVPGFLGTGPGAFAFQRSDGMWVIVAGGANTNTCLGNARFQLYNPFSNRISATQALAAATGFGAQAMQRPDGSWLIVNGAGSAAGGAVVTTQIYLEKEGAMLVGIPAGTAVVAGGIAAGTAPSGGAGPGAGAFNFQRDDGKYVMIEGMMGSFGTYPSGSTALSQGAASAQVLQYDAGWVTSGTYKSEHLAIPDLDADSTLSWKPVNGNMAGLTAEVKTASTFANLQTAPLKEVTNGGLINPTSGNTAVQVNFNFSRNFPSKEGIWSDVWMGNSSVKNQTFRIIPNPILSEFKINKDKDLLNLQADGLSLFRVSSNGDIYTSANGAYRTGGADLAENYSSQEPLEKGEVVAIDSINDHSVKKALYQNQPDVLGVVSSDPGFVAGSYTEDSYPIALVGRVPVKVSTENGPIKVGDYLTAASVPGHAMRATKSGRVIGKALENLDPSKLSVCPSGGYIIPDRQCGTIMMFVNLTDYSGMSVEKLMSEVQPVGQEVAAGETSGESAPSGQAFAEYSKQAEILAFLKDMQAKEAQNPNPSEILTGRLSADKEVITPQVFTDLLVAKTIRADRIEGLEFIQMGVETIQEGMENNTVQVKDLGQQVAELQGIINKLTDKSGGLAVEGPAQFKGPAVFEKIAQFLDKVIFRNSVEFANQVTFNKDTAGYAIVKEGADRVAITFEQEYANLPIVNTSLSLQQIEDEEERQAAEELLLVSDVKMIITNVTTRGFEIRINQQALSDIPFSWQAISVKDARTFESVNEEINNETLPLADIIPTPNTAPNLAPGETTPEEPVGEVIGKTADESVLSSDTESATVSSDTLTEEGAIE